MKVYGYLVYAPGHWPITPGNNGNRQVRAIVAAKSKGDAFDRMVEVGMNDSRYAFNQGVCTTGNPDEIATATARPGVVFHVTRDMGHEYVEAKPR